MVRKGDTKIEKTIPYCTMSDEDRFVPVTCPSFARCQRDRRPRCGNNGGGVLLVCHSRNDSGKQKNQHQKRPVTHACSLDCTHFGITFVVRRELPPHRSVAEPEAVRR